MLDPVLGVILGLMRTLNLNDMIPIWCMANILMNRMSYRTIRDCVDVG